jgi:hypothetical protein
VRLYHPFARIVSLITCPVGRINYFVALGSVRGNLTNNPLRASSKRERAVVRVILVLLGVIAAYSYFSRSGALAPPMFACTRNPCPSARVS